MKNSLNLTNGMVVMLIGISFILIGIDRPMMSLAGVVIFISGVFLDNRQWNRKEEHIETKPKPT